MGRSALLRLLSVVALVVGTLSLWATPAAAQEFGFIYGTITAQATGQPIAACVEAYATPTEVVGSACTSVDGTYTIAVAPGTYRLRVVDLTRTYATRWAYAADSYDAADPITVTVGQTVVVDVALPLAGAIVGTVTDAATGAPVNGCVQVLAVGSDDFAAYACTDDLGQYRAVLPDAGQYNVQFTADYYVSQWAYDRATRDLADVITVSAGQDTRVDAQLTPLGQISGRVTDLAGAPLAFITVYAYLSDQPTSFTYAETDFDGLYRIRGLPAGAYHVKFVENSFGNYVSEWWNDSPDLAHADSIQVSLATDTTGIDAALGQSGLITGTVTDAATGQPLAGVCARAVLASTGELVDEVSPHCTGLDGHYEVNGVGGSAYKVLFEPFDPAYRSQWYRNKLTQKSANRIRVAYGQTVTGIDAAMQPTG